MARKKKEVYVGPVNEAEKAKVDATSVRQSIANLCGSIGDKSFVIRQAQSEITGFYAQIDQLRDQLRALEQPSGPEVTK